MDILIRNRKKEIVAIAKVSSEDFEWANSFSWYLKEDGYAMSTTNVNGKCIHIRMHNAIMERICGYRPVKQVVDHIDNDRLNNIRLNLRYVDPSINSQNRKKKDGTTSKYIGVYYDKIQKKYKVSSMNVKLGTYVNEEDAGRAYDAFVLKKFGADAKTNGLISLNDNINLDDFIKKKVITRDLPRNILFKNGKYMVKLIYNKKEFTKNAYTLEEAIIALEKIKSECLKNNAEILVAHNKKIIKSSNNTDILIDESNYDELSKYKWRIKDDGYAVSDICKTTVLMHRMIMKAKTGEIIDHINNNRLDNRLENLRIVSPSVNSHNSLKAKNSTSKFKGVCKYENNWISSIKLNGVSYYLGRYKTEELAALAYNIKALELYANLARLNNLEDKFIVEQTEYVKKRMTEGPEKTSIYRGVSYHVNSGKYRSCLCYNYKVYHIGEFEDEGEAALAYNQKVMEVIPKDMINTYLNILDEHIIIKGVREKRKLTSQYTGVSWHKATNKWRAVIRHNKKVYELGIFDNEINAALAYNKKAQELYKEEANKYLNVINYVINFVPNPIV
jgi:hypothetical protein